MSDPFKRGPRRMFPAAPEVAPLPVEPPPIDTARGADLDAIGNFYGVAREGEPDARYRQAIRAAILPEEYGGLSPLTVDVREAWDSLTTADRVQAALMAGGEQLDAIGALCSLERQGLSDTLFRVSVVTAIRADPARRRLLTHARFRAVRSPIATEDELERMFRAPLYGDPRPTPSRADIEHASGPNLVALANSVGLDLGRLNSVGDARNALLEHCGYQTTPRRP